MVLNRLSIYYMRPVNISLALRVKEYKKESDLIFTIKKYLYRESTLNRLLTRLIRIHYTLM